MSEAVVKEPFCVYTDIMDDNERISTSDWQEAFQGRDVVRGGNSFKVSCTKTLASQYIK